MNDFSDAWAGLAGRTTELGIIETIIENVDEGGGTIRIAGDPGIGKSSILRAAAQVAANRSHTVLSAKASEGEAHLAFALLHQLLHPILDRISYLPPAHRDALESAFGFSDSPISPGDRFFISLAALELLADVANQGPVLVTVDDLAWVDDASREAIDFISRRITDERIVMIAACRLSTPPESVFGSVLLQLEPLTEQASRELLDRQPTKLSHDQKIRVLEAAAGNPLAIVELAKAMARADSSSLFDTIPLTNRLERSFAAPLDGFDSVTRMTLLLMAVQDSDRLSETDTALAQLFESKDSRSQLETPVAVGMVIIEGDTFRFRHPLVRSAIVQAAKMDTLNAAHEAWATALAAHPDRSVWHRSLAATEHNEQLAAELDAGASRAIARGGPGLAEKWLRRAAELSEDESHRGHRLLLAAESAFELGRQETMSELMAEARGLALDPSDYARLALLEGAFDDGIPGDEDNIKRLVAAADRARQNGEEDLAASLLLGACNSCYWGAAGETLRALVRPAIDALSFDRRDPRVVVLHAELDPFVHGIEVVSDLAVWAVEEVSDVVLLGALARAGFLVGDFERGLGFASRASELLRRQGRIALLTQSLVLEAFTSMYLGHWDVTLVSSDEARRFGVETKQPLWAACARLAQGNLAGLRGDTKTALAIAGEVEESAVRTGNRSILNGTKLTRGLAAMTEGRHGDAFGEFRQMVDPNDVAYHYPQCAWVVDYLAETASLSGQVSDAGDLFSRVEILVKDSTAPGVVRALALGRAMLADDDQAEVLYEAATRLQVNASPWYCARVDLAFGSWLRRQRRISESRRPLAAAQAVFDALGASAWSRRAVQELGASGHRTRPNQPDGWSKLSAQELQVAQLAALGLTNREIGERLFLSHRTVSSHLYRAFPKLGIRSRSQLYRALAVGGALNDDVRTTEVPGDPDTAVPHGEPDAADPAI